MNDNKENNNQVKPNNKFSEFPKKSAPRNIIIRIVLVLLTCWIITYLIWNFVNINAQNELRSYLGFRARDVNERIEQRLANYEQVLRSVRGLFNVSDHVNRAEFHAFFNSLKLEKSYPGIQGVGFSLIIPSKQIKKHTASVCAEGFSNYKIWPEGKRKIYTSIIYLEPFKGLNLRAFGYDMFSEPVRQKAMETSRDSDESKISGKIILVQETGKQVQAGFLMYLPVYRIGASHKTVQERRANIEGWVYSPFRMDNFIAGLFGEQSADLDVEIFDGNKISKETKMYDTKVHTLKYNHLLSLNREIKFDGHKWTILVKSTPELESRMGFNFSTIILIVGIVLSLLIAIITWQIAKKRLVKIIAENKLLESETRFKQISEGTEEWIWEVDVNGVFTYMNQYVKKLLGYDPEELIGIKNFYDFFEPEHKEELIQGALEAFGRKESIRNFINCNIHKDGRRIILSTSGFPILDNENNFIGYRGINVDITNRQKAEDELKISEMKFRSIVEGTKAILFNVNTHGIFTYLNEAACKKLEMTNQELLSKIYLRFVHPENRAKVHSIFSEQLKNPTLNKSVDVRIITNSGKEGWLSFLINPIYVEGKITGLSSVGQDITERKLAELKLKESEGKYRTLFENIPVGIGITDLTGKLVDFNDSILKPGGYSRDDLIRTGTVEKLYYNLSDRETLIPLLKEKGTITQHPIKFKRKDGSPYDALLTLTIININDQPMIQAVIEDITERKQAEDSLTLFRTLVDKSNDAIEVVDMETAQFIDVNERACTDLGYTRSELLNMKIFDIDPGQTPENFRSLMDQIQLSNATIIEAIHQRKDGSTFPVEINVTVVELEKSYIISVVRDITDRKQAETKLKESGARLTDAMKIAKLSTWEYNFALDRFTFPDQSFSLINTTAEHEGGNIMSSEHFAQKYIYPDDRVLIEKEIRKALETPDPAYTSQMEYRVIYAPGEIGYFAANVRVEKDADNRTIKALGVNQDITERKRMEEIVLRINKAVESSGEAICMSDPQGHHFYHNKAFTEIFEYTVEEVEAAGGGTAIYVNNDVGRKVFDIIMGGGTWNGEVEMLSKSGRKFNVSLRADAITDANGAIVGLVGMHTDITQRIRAEAEIKSRNEQLIKINAEKDKFFSIIAHDLKSPFNGFLNLTELMADKTEDFSLAEFADYSKSLNESARILYKLLENLLEWAQMQKGSISFVPEEINLSTIISQNIEIISQRALQKGIAILNEVPASERVYADNKMVDTVFRNLLSNAVKFTKKGGEIIIKSKKAASAMVEASVSDTGIGLSEINIKKLFKIEEKFTSKGTEGEPSTGLGLVLCKEFIEKNGGKIWVESDKGKGSTFYFTVPSFPLNNAI